MEITRERFLDDSRTYHFTIGVRSRTTEAHSVLTSLTAEERAEVNNVIVDAMDRIAAVLRHRLPNRR